MFERIRITKKLKQRMGKAVSIVLSAAMLVTALPADMLGGDHKCEGCGKRSEYDTERWNRYRRGSNLFRKH